MIPWVAVWMAVILKLAIFGRIAGDHRRTKALVALLIAYPATYLLYNLNEFGPLWAGLLWGVFPWLVLYQWLNLPIPAIFGELAAVPYILHSVGMVAEYPSQAAADVLGLLMVATLGGPIIARLAGDIADRVARGGGADRVFSAKDNQPGG